MLGALLAAVSGLALACGENNRYESPSPSDTATNNPSATATRQRPGVTPTPTRTLSEARDLMRDGAFDEAAGVFEAIAEVSEPAEAAQAELEAGIAWNEAGDGPRAIRLLRRASNNAPEGTSLERNASFLLATRLLEAGEPGEAFMTLTPLFATPVDDPLQLYVDSLYARAAVAVENDDAAAAAWARVLAHPGATPSMRTDIFRQQARAAAADGDDAAAAELWGQAAASSESSVDRMAMAEAALEAGDEATWAAVLRAIVVNDPGSRLALAALGLLEAREYVVDRIDAGYVYYRNRDYTRARENLGAAIDAGGLTPARHAFARYYLAASYDDDGYFEDAIPIYDSVAAIDPTSPYVHRAAYWAARAAENMGDTATALARYDALVANGPAGEFTAETAFRAGYIRYRDGLSAEAITAWQSAGIGDARTLYWTGRAHRQLGNEAEATAAFQAAVALDPLDFFGVVSARALGTGDFPSVRYRPLETPAPIDWRAIAAWYAGDPAAALPPLPESAASSLASLGLYDSAQAVLAESAMEPLSRLRAAHEYGLIPYAASLAYQLEETGPGTAPPEDLLRLQFPLSYVTSLKEAAQEHGVDPLFLAALVRTESFWDRDAVSIADAYGLTQVIEPTGRAIARELGYEDWEYRDLFRPPVALEFGAYYIAAQLKAYGEPHAALSAYNAGPGNAADWVALSPTDDPADFVETVDFIETRHYVELVLSAYAHYDALYR